MTLGREGVPKACERQGVCEGDQWQVPKMGGLNRDISGERPYTTSQCVQIPAFTQEGNGERGRRAHGPWNCMPWARQTGRMTRNGKLKARAVGELSDADPKKM